MPDKPNDLAGVWVESDLQKRLDRLVQVAYATKQDWEIDWEDKYGRPFPKTESAFIRLLSEAGADPEWILKGQYEILKAMCVIEGYLIRGLVAERVRSAPAKIAASAKADDIPLSATEKAVLSIIKNQPRGQGMVGKEILQKLRIKRITIKESTLRKHILPKLAKLGVVNHPSAGGYLFPRHSAI